jgi:hypothetical protein
MLHVGGTSLQQHTGIAQVREYNTLALLLVVWTLCAAGLDVLFAAACILFSKGGVQAASCDSLLQQVFALTH